MKLSTAGWIGLIIGLIGGLAGMIVAVIQVGWPAVIFGLVFLGIFFGIFWSVMFKPMYIQRKLEKKGIPADAQIIEVKDTGITINNNPQVKLLLEVKSPYGPPYKVETKVIVPRINPGLYRPGMTIPVLIDPENKNLVAINYSGNVTEETTGNVAQVLTGPWAGIGKEEAERRLGEIDARNKRLIASGVSARAIVTKYTWLGIFVNGNNPAVELIVEVLPRDRPAFTGNAVGVIMESAVQKFQAGEEIFVKYNPENTSELTIEHS